MYYNLYIDNLTQLIYYLIAGIICIQGSSYIISFVVHNIINHT